MSQSQGQPLPPFKLVRPSGPHRTILSNLSYPSRPHSHVSWSRSSVPLRLAKNLDARSHPTLAFNYASATATPNSITTNETNRHAMTNEHDSEFCSVTHAFRGIRDSFLNELLIFTSKLKLLIQKLISAQPTPLVPSL